MSKKKSPKSVSGFSVHLPYLPWRLCMSFGESNVTQKSVVCRRVSFYYLRMRLRLIKLLCKILLCSAHAPRWSEIGHGASFINSLWWIRLKIPIRKNIAGKDLRRWLRACRPAIALTLRTGVTSPTLRFLHWLKIQERIA